MKNTTKRLSPIFNRSEVARILGVTPLTILNREKRKVYPPAKRDLNNYRIYSLEDIFNLQLLTFSQCDPKPVLECMFDKGYNDPKYCADLVSATLNKKMAYE